MFLDKILKRKPVEVGTVPRVRSKNNRFAAILLLCGVVFMSGVVLWSGYLGKNYYLATIGLGMFGAASMMIFNEYQMVWEEAAYLQSVSRVLSKTSQGPDLSLPFGLDPNIEHVPVNVETALTLILEEAEAMTLLPIGSSKGPEEYIPTSPKAPKTQQVLVSKPAPVSKLVKQKPVEQKPVEQKPVEQDLVKAPVELPPDLVEASVEPELELEEQDLVAAVKKPEVKKAAPTVTTYKPFKAVPPAPNKFFSKK